MRSLFVMVLLCASTAHASPLIEELGGFGGMGALQARHAGASASAAYFNPALLSDAEAGVSMGALVLRTEIGVRVDGRDAADAVPDGLVNAIHADGTRLDNYPIGTDLLQHGRAAAGLNPALPSRPRQHAGTGHRTYTYEALGLVVKLFKQHLSLGFYGLLPNKDLTTFRSHYVDEREQYSSNSLHPELYGDRMTALSIAFGAGVRVAKSLSIGAGAALGILARAQAPVYVADAGKLNELQLNLDAKARVSLVPHVGVAWRPGARWRLTATVHAPQKVTVDAGFTFLLATAIEQGSTLSFTHFFQPWQVGAGLGYDVLAERDLTISATGSLLYGRWSTYLDRQSDRPAGAFRWEDTLTGAAGMRIQGGALSFALDGQYRPTPVPLQRGRTNYVDNDRVGLALAIEYGFELWETKLKLGLQLQSHRLIERHTRKLRPPSDPRGQNRTPQLVADEVPDDAVVANRPVAGREGVQTNNPGWPGFWSVGWVTSAGLYLTVSL